MYPTIEEILRAMEKMWEPKEEEFAMMKILLNLQETYPIHGCGERDFELMRYKCPTCGLVLDRN